MRAPIHDFHISNLLTYGALAAGTGAIVLASDSRSRAFAAAALGVAAIADTFDGRFARFFRRTPRQAHCGRALDSLVDAVAFGAAPVAVVFSAVPHDTGWPLFAWWGAAVLYVVATVTRLAFYDVEGDATHFVGLPTPAAALLCATALLIPTSTFAPSWPLIVAGLAMVAPVGFPRPRGAGLAAFVCWAVAVVWLHSARAL
jgi:CDP-diacylglycerol---serine O-phosphatidyltransferase